MKIVKNYTYKLMLFVTTAFLVVTTSCQQFVDDVKPTDILDASVALQSLNDYETAVLGSYSSILGYYGGTIQSIGGFPADEVKIGSGNNGAGQFLYNHGYTATTGAFGTMWNVAYSAINRANTVLAGIDTYELQAADDETAAKRDQLKAEALALRALAHFDLVRNFGQPDQTSAGAGNPGVPVVTTVLGPADKPSRNTIGEVYAQVISDLTAAKGLIGSPTDITRFTPAGIDALLARVYLYSGDYNNAITSANAAIGAVALADQAGYTAAWENGGSGGSAGMIFRLGVPAGGVAIGNTWYLPANENSRLAPSNDLVSSFPANDVRSGLFFQNNATAGEVVVFKYAGTTTSPSLAQIPVLRTAEMYLIRAEAYFRTSQEANALADYNALRTARITGYTDETLSGAALLNGIIAERFRELCFEGHRWYDLRRNGLAVTRNDCNGTNCSLAVGDFRFTFPIPLAEIQANPNIAQNPNW